MHDCQKRNEKRERERREKKKKVKKATIYGGRNLKA
jgi:hypothetical protein